MNLFRDLCIQAGGRAIPRGPAPMAESRREPPWLPANRFQSVLASPEARLEPLPALHSAPASTIGRRYMAPPASNGRTLTFPLQRPAASGAAATWKSVSCGEYDRAVDSSVHSGCRDTTARLPGSATLTPAPHLPGWPYWLPDPSERLRLPKPRQIPARRPSNRGRTLAFSRPVSKQFFQCC